MSYHQISKVIKGKQYFYLIENRKIKGKTRTRHVAYIGKQPLVFKNGIEGQNQIEEFIAEKEKKVRSKEAKVMKHLLDFQSDNFSGIENARDGMEIILTTFGFKKFRNVFIRGNVMVNLENGLVKDRKTRQNTTALIGHQTLINSDILKQRILSQYPKKRGRKPSQTLENKDFSQFKEEIGY